MKIARLKISKGEDKRVTFFFKNASSSRPINMDDITNIQFIFEKTDRTNSILDMVAIPATKASALFNGGKFSSVIPGSSGNTTILIFDGVKTVDQAVNEWNSNNVNNVTYTGIIGSFVPNANNLRLTDGLDSYVPVSIVNSAIGEVSLVIEDKVSNSFKIGDNQSFKVILDFGMEPQGVRRKARINNILDVTA